MKSMLFIGVAAVVLSGCQNPAGVPTRSAAPSELSAASSSAIARDIVSRFAEHVGQGKGTIVLKEDPSPFGQAVAAALRGWGYAVDMDQKIDANNPSIQLAYMIDDFEGQTLARLSTSELELARAYSTTRDGASPASPLSIMQRN